MPRCTPEDVDEAVAAAHCAFRSGAWPALTATARGKLLRRLGDLIQRDAEKLAAIEVRDNGKLLAEMAGQLRYIPEWFHYYGGLKITGGTTTMVAGTPCVGGAPLLINDPENRLQIFNQPCAGGPTAPSYTFTEPGRYLVICAFLPHFELQMWGWVIVKD